MMRNAIAIMGLYLLAACGEAGEPAAPVEEKPVMLRGGQWSLVRTTTGYNTPTVTAEEYAAKVGKKSESDVCIAVDRQGYPDADALAGDEGGQCSYKETGIGKGRFVATLQCRKGPRTGGGTSELAMEGNYTADSMTIGVSMTQTVGGHVILRTTHDLTGKRTGSCKTE